MDRIDRDQTPSGHGQGFGYSCGCPKPAHISCDLLILVEEATDAVASVNFVDPGRRVAGERSQGSSLTQAAMRSVIVVVALEVAQHGCSVPSVDDQKAVEQFTAD